MFHRPSRTLLRSNDLIKWTLIASFGVHLVLVLGISFVMPSPDDNMVIGPPLKITLVSTPSEEAPEETYTLAQADSLGESEATAALPALQAALSTPASRDSSAQQDELLSVPADQGLLATERSESGEPSQPLTREQLREEINLAYLNAQSRPREVYVSARARQDRFAAYIEKWRLLVERVGNLNYPEAARQQKIEGSLVLDAAINADGTVQSVRVLDSSGHKILDDAAMRIVHLAAPYDRFPREFASEIDTLHIVRTWEFGADRLISRTIE